MVAKTLLHNIRVWTWKRKYRPGHVLSRLIARNTLRDIQVIGVREIAEGSIVGRTRTWQVISASGELQEIPPYGEVQRLEIAHLWDWTEEPRVSPTLKPMPSETKSGKASP